MARAERLRAAPDRAPLAERTNCPSRTARSLSAADSAATIAPRFRPPARLPSIPSCRSFLSGSPDCKSSEDQELVIGKFGHPERSVEAPDRRQIAHHTIELISGLVEFPIMFTVELVFGPFQERLGNQHVPFADFGQYDSQPPMFQSVRQAADPGPIRH